MLRKISGGALVAGVLVAGLGGCTSKMARSSLPVGYEGQPVSTQSPPMTDSAPPRRDAMPAASLSAAPPIDITPLSSFQDSWSAASGSGADFSDAYTRLMIFSEVSGESGGEPTKPMPYEGREWLTRALVARDYSINLTAKVMAGAFEATVPLATISHQSGSKGEQWSRAIHHSKQSFPLFLVSATGGTSTPTVRISVNGDRSYASRAAATAVQVALGVAQATGQNTRLITALSEKSVRESARAMDEAISRLFGSGLSEEHWSDRDLKHWNVSNGRPQGARITFRIPSDTKDWNSQANTVGTWTVTFDYPRPSVFSDWRICGANELPRCTTTRNEAEGNVLSEVNPGQVLNFPIAAGEQGLGSIRAFLSQQDWYTASQVALANPARRTTAASTLCRTIVNEITGVGLNAFDAGIVVWAVAKGMPMSEGVSLDTAADCRAMIQKVEGAQRLSLSGVTGRGAP